MIKYINNSDHLIISHIADIDGMGSVILAKLIHEDIDIILCEVKELNEIFNKLTTNNYKQIYVTDLSIRGNDLIKLIDDHYSNLLHFDHHIDDYNINSYDWSTTIHEINGFMPSGTSLFYDYLLENYNDNKYLSSNYTKEFVEAIRSYDTWDFKNTGNLNGKYLTEIFSIIGIEEFLNKYYNKIITNYSLDIFSFDKDEMTMVLNLEKDINDYVDDCDKGLIITNFLGYKVGISISEKYRSEVGNVLSAKHKDLDFILIANFVRRTFSFRTTNNIDLNEVAKKIGGGGHEKAAGASMNDENVTLFFNSIVNNTIK